MCSDLMQHQVDGYEQQSYSQFLFVYWENTVKLSLCCVPDTSDLDISHLNLELICGTALF